MMAPDGGAVLRRRSRVTPAAADEHPAPYDAGPIWMRVLPPAVMLVIGLWRITGPSYWRDEAATLSAVQRPFAELVRMTGHIDAVHGTYYMLIWVLVQLGGPGELVTRLPSALAMAAAAAAVAALGLCCGVAAGRAGLRPDIRGAAAGKPLRAGRAGVRDDHGAGRGGQLRAGPCAHQRRPQAGWLVYYAFCLGVMGLLNVFSLLLIGAHAVTVALAWRRASRAAAGPGSEPPPGRWRPAGRPRRWGPSWWPALRWRSASSSAARWAGSPRRTWWARSWGCAGWSARR